MACFDKGAIEFCPGDPFRKSVHAEVDGSVSKSETLSNWYCLRDFSNALQAFI